MREHRCRSCGAIMTNVTEEKGADGRTNVGIQFHGGDVMSLDSLEVVRCPKCGSSFPSKDFEGKRELPEA